MSWIAVAILLHPVVSVLVQYGSSWLYRKLVPVLPVSFTEELQDERRKNDEMRSAVIEFMKKQTGKDWDTE